MGDRHDPRMHTAEHLLNQAMVRTLECGRCFSAHLNRKKSKCDYHLTRDITESEKAAIEGLVNQAIASDLEVAEEYWARSEALNEFDLTRLPEESGDTVRIVRIGNFDVCPCIGPHVRTTGELGSFTITTRDFADGVLRLRFKLDAGPGDG